MDTLSGDSALAGARITSAAQADVAAPSFEHCWVAVGVGTGAPRLSWKTIAGPSWRQRAYELEISRGGVVRTFPVASDGSVLVDWPDSPLTSREQAVVRVRVEGSDGHWSAWSESGRVEAGLLSPLDWTASGITSSWPEDSSDDRRRPPILRREFSVDGEIAQARLYVTAHGLYELELNGECVGDDTLSPGWTAYTERLRYYTYDVTSALRPGENAIGAWLGDGWWRGRIGFDGGVLNLYGSDLGLLAQLEVTLSDGTMQRIGTDSSWRAAPSPILASGLYDGETFDAREVQAGWSEPGFDDRGWAPVRIVEFATGTLVAPEGPPVRCTQEIEPLSVKRTDSGSLLVDFGQNFAGRVHVTAAAGISSELTIRHAEVLVDGKLYVRTLRRARATDRYLGSGGAIDWEPRFTIHGFRYAEISGFDGDPEQLRIVGRVYHSDMARTGYLTTSDPDLNRLHENVVWSMRSNFVSLPTDCPQRDERLGWTGDIQVFAPTASYLYDCSGFLTSWLADVAAEQRRFGTVPWYVPVVPGPPAWTPIKPGAVWGDVAVLTPWTVWERFDDRCLLEQQYESAKTWVDQIAALAGPSRLWDTGMQLGDWLDPTAPPDDPAQAVTDRYLVATAYFAHSAERLADIARVLGREADVEYYSRLAAEVKEAFVAKWGDGDGLLKEQTQTAYALAIMFGLLGSDTKAAGDALARLVAARGNRIGAGFAGVNLVSDALTATDHADAAYNLLLERRTPSWLSMVEKGATTIWERWDSQLDDGTVNPGQMTSFNHYALGSIADWMHRVIGGIEAAAPGYRRVRFAPIPGGGLTSAQAHLESPYGPISSTWRIVDGEFTLTVELPTGTTGSVILPAGSEHEVGPGAHSFSEALGDGEAREQLPPVTS